MPEVITLGEPMVVLIAQQTGALHRVESFTPGIAGAELNVTVGVSRLGHPALYVTRLGKDPYGERILDFMKEEGLALEGILSDEEHLTGSYLKGKVEEGDPPIFYYRKNSAASYLDAKDIDQISFEGAKLLHLTGISPALSPYTKAAVYRAIERAREHEMMITFDPNIRRTLWKSEEEMRTVLNDIASRCDVVLPGVSEGMLLTGASDMEGIADFYLDRGAKLVIIKNGGKGAFYKKKDGSEGAVPGFHVERIVDTVGAGDAFASGVICGILEGKSIEEAIRYGNAMGSIIITSKGDNDILPDRKALESYILGSCSA